MSGVDSESNKWRPNRASQASQQPGQVRQNPQNQRQDSPREAPPPPNAWGMSGRIKVQRKQNGPGEEQHVPVKGFAAQEVQDGLKQSYRDLASGNVQIQRYKPATDQSVQSKPGAWGQKASNMSNNKDFFLELRKQITALYNVKERAGG